MGEYRVAQPWGNIAAGEVTVVSTHGSIRDAYAALDAAADKMIRTCGRADAISLIVIDAAGLRCARPEAN
jgi:hypothetical protein